MKRKEREHLKEDPFQQFIAKAMELLKTYKKEIFIGIAAVAAVAVIIVVMLIIQHFSVLAENKLYAQA